MLSVRAVYVLGSLQLELSVEKTIQPIISQKHIDPIALKQFQEYQKRAAALQGYTKQQERGHGMSR